MTYFDELCRAMEMLGKEENTIFLGQAVRFPGTATYNTLKNVPDNKRMEFPVAENMQLGYSTGLAISGLLPITIFPRWNFFILATDQLVNHLDKLPEMSDGEYVPKVIIRVGVGSKVPLNPQKQHLGDFTEAYRLMCETVNIVRLDRKEQVVPAYQEALDAKYSTILVEISDLYNS